MIAASAVRASARARSKQRATIALMLPSTASTRRMQDSSSSTRSSRVVRLKDSNAAFAAATARFTSSSLPREICAQTSSVAGLMTSKSLGVTGSTHSPLM